MNKYKPIFSFSFYSFLNLQNTAKDKQGRLMVFTATEQPESQKKGGTDNSNCFNKPTVS